MSDLERCKKYLRSSLISIKGGVPLNQICHLYYDTVGENVPFRKFGFSNLESFLYSIPDVCKISRDCGVLTATGVASKATEHIEQMVVQQKSNKKRSRSKVKASIPRPSIARYGSANGIGRLISSTKSLPAKGRLSSPLLPLPAKERLSSPILPLPAHWRPHPSNGNSVPSLAKANPTNQVTNSKGSISGCDARPSSAAIKEVQDNIYIDDDVDVFEERVHELLQGRPKGMFAAQIEKLYKKKWVNSLPSNWLDELEQSKRVKVNKTGNAGAVVVPLMNTDNTSDEREKTEEKLTHVVKDTMPESLDRLVTEPVQESIINSRLDLSSSRIYTEVEKEFLAFVDKIKSKYSLNNLEYQLSNTPEALACNFRISMKLLEDNTDREP